MKRLTFFIYKSLHKNPYISGVKHEINHVDYNSFYLIMQEKMQNFDNLYSISQMIKKWIYFCWECCFLIMSVCYK